MAMGAHLRSRRRQRLFDVYTPLLARDSYGQGSRTYAKGRRVAGVFRTGGSSKGQMAEAIQGTQSNVFETRYIPNFTWSLEFKLIDAEDGTEYRVVGFADEGLMHNTFTVDLEEVVQ